MQLKYLSLFVYITAVYRFSHGQNITITTPIGKITGLIQVTKSNHTFYGFKSVRYAQPPVGNLRFKPPVPADPWNGTYDATHELSKCYQTSALNSINTEDCLFLDIYTPQLSRNATLPVLFFIYGGGFLAGAATYRPEFFMEHEVLLVEANYRLGLFGFLSTNDMVVPGNMGLKDQNLALKWVQQNIEYFGGDPSKVTIYGQSAGSASVSYHLLSPKSAGLFRAAIQESGSALTPWAYQRDQRRLSFQTASFIDPKFTSNSSQDLLDFLLKASPTHIRSASKYVIDSHEQYGDKEIQNGFCYAPVIEPDHEDAFITQSMYESFASGNFNKVPAIIGMNAEEGMMLHSAKFKLIVTALNTNESLLVPRNMHIDDTNPNRDNVIRAIEDFYGISKNFSYEDQIAGAIRYFTDQCFSRSITKQAELQANYSDVYFYNFAFQGEMGGNGARVPGTGNVTHGEEIGYFFPKSLRDGRSTDDLDKFPKADVQAHNRLVKLWVNFATTLNPTPETDELFQNIIWPKVDLSNGLQYLNIDENLSVETNPRDDAYRMWNDLYDKYAVKPLDGF